VGTLSGTTAWCLTAESWAVDIVLAVRRIAESLRLVESEVGEPSGLSTTSARAPSARLPIAPATFLLARHAIDELATTMSAHPICAAEQPRTR
jgi:hypothetical protein